MDMCQLCVTHWPIIVIIPIITIIIIIIGSSCSSICPALSHAPIESCVPKIQTKERNANIP